MADLGSLAEVWRQSLELNLRYYSAVGRLTAEYYTDLMAALANLRMAATPSPTPAPTMPAQTAPATTAPQTPTAAAASAQQAGVMVLESEVGGQARRLAGGPAPAPSLCLLAPPAVIHHPGGGVQPA